MQKHFKGQNSLRGAGGLWATRRADSLEKTLMLGKTGGKRRRGQQRMRWLDGITNSMDMGLSKLRATVKGREAWHAANSWHFKESDVT